jgi:peptidoglycan DL-endopeptidase CwlO
MSMAAEIMTTKPGPTRDTLVSWPRGSGGWGRAGHLGWRVLAVSVLVIMLVFPWGPVATADDVAPPAGPTAQEAAAARDAVRAGELDVAQAEQAQHGVFRRTEKGLGSRHSQRINAQ